MRVVGFTESPRAALVRPARNIYPSGLHQVTDATIRSRHRNYLGGRA